MSAAEGVFPATSMPDPDWWQTLWPRPDRVLEKLSLDKTAEVVDLCCGDGLFTIALARMVRHVTAIDLDPEMLAAVRNRAVAEGITNCTFTVGDAYDLVALVPEPWGLSGILCEGSQRGPLLGLGATHEHTRRTD